jgi:hypothetical protein
MAVREALVDVFEEDRARQGGGAQPIRLPSPLPAAQAP